MYLYLRTNNVILKFGLKIREFKKGYLVKSWEPRTIEITKGNGESVEVKLINIKVVLYNYLKLN